MMSLSQSRTEWWRIRANQALLLDFEGEANWQHRDRAESAKSFLFALPQSLGILGEILKILEPC